MDWNSALSSPVSWRRNSTWRVTSVSSSITSSRSPRLTRAPSATLYSRTKPPLPATRPILRQPHDPFGDRDPRQWQQREDGQRGGGGGTADEHRPPRRNSGIVVR